MIHSDNDPLIPVDAYLKIKTHSSLFCAITKGGGHVGFHEQDAAHECWQAALAMQYFNWLGAQAALGNRGIMSDIQNYILSAYGLNASVTNFGASLQDLRLADDDIPLILGFENPSDYATNTSHVKASAGSYANRIANGRYQLNDKTYQLDQNENNQHMLHGGHQGTGVQLWDCIEACEDAVLFNYINLQAMGFEVILNLYADMRWWHHSFVYHL